MVEGANGHERLCRVLLPTETKWSISVPVSRASGLRVGRRFESTARYPLFRNGLPVSPVYIRVLELAFEPSGPQFDRFLDRPTGREPHDLSAPLDGLYAYIPGSSSVLAPVQAKLR
ncbi:uncharacterized protein SCHCODRAFT_02631273, partial [Schizophyllum commune H4-8]|uniref:uncharacterized protein n=1 Tax=Schizophyllum commune (strain H4-8 / FGSC 9210) TaxID=578458 RepID=UPI0021603D42